MELMELIYLWTEGLMELMELMELNVTKWNYLPMGMIDGIEGY